MVNENRETFFDLPNSPEEFGVVLPLPELRKIDYTALEWNALVRSFIEYIKTYFPDQFNDFTASNAVMMLAELMAYGASNASLHADILANEAFLPTAKTRNAVDQHLKLINRPIKRQTPAVVDISCRIRTTIDQTVKIQAGERFSIVGPDGEKVIYELYRAPGDFTSPIEILPNRSGVIAVGIEGQFQDPINVLSDGNKRQTITVADALILNEPIYVDVTVGSDENGNPIISRWTRVAAIERAGANDEVYEVRFFDNGADIIFGDDINGKAPISGQQISVKYRTGGGIRGRIAPYAINESRSILLDSGASVAIDFRNIEASSGGKDEESLDVARRVAPKEASALKSATTGQDYAVIAKNFSHPVFGSVMKAVATTRTELNANLVELYVLAEGPRGIPVTPSEGLKRGMKSFFAPIMVLTDELRVYDGELLPVDVEMQVTIARGADQSLVIDNVNKAIDDFFNITNREMGQGLYKAQLYEKIQRIDGVRFVSIHSPADNLYPFEKDSTEFDNVVKHNQLIVLGQKKIDFFAEKETR